MTIIKICGLKTIEDSLATCKAGADMLGFNIYESSVRHITPRICRPIVDRVKEKYPHVLCAGIFVNHKVEEIESIMKHCHLDIADFDRDRDELLARTRAAGVPRRLGEFHAGANRKHVRPPGGRADGPDARDAGCVRREGNRKR